ncbi:MAG: M56 family metallopeptidase, partial [Oscillospiraceae bacterium]|nr:M56 family metallopeptidase [Oscillospiraceae bacterium]
MTETIIQAILESSFMAGIAAVVVMLLRIPMRKLPRKWSYMLWAVVFFRCLCPFSAESEISIFNVLNTSEQSASVQITEAVVYDSQETYLTDENTINIFDTLPGQYASEQSTSVQITESVYDDKENYVTEYYYGNVQFPDDDPVYKDYSGNAAFNKTVAVADAVPGTASTKGQIDRDTVILIIWATGVLVMVWYAVVSYTLLMQKVSAAVKMPDGVYETDRISTAFTAGFFVPKIYLPCGLSENERRLIIAHEKVHIKRFDIITKPLAFAGLALHWFNPLIWAAFALMSRDMEFSCDEAVLEMLGSEEKEDYSEALLRASMKKSGLAAFPLAFAETGIKKRVENVLEYKKQKITGAVLSAAIVLTACAALGTDPVSGYGESVTDISLTLLEKELFFPAFLEIENRSGENVLVIYVDDDYEKDDPRKPVGISYALAYSINEIGSGGVCCDREKDIEITDPDKITKAVINDLQIINKDDVKYLAVDMDIYKNDDADEYIQNITAEIEIDEGIEDRSPDPYGYGLMLYGFDDIDVYIADGLNVVNTFSVARGWSIKKGSDGQIQLEEQGEYEKVTWSFEAEEQEFLKKFRDFSFDIDLEQAVPYGLGITYPEANTVYLFSTPADGINMYGYDYNGRFPIVIIEHDGITDAFMENWTSRMFPAVAFCNDYDGDGENEIAACYYIGHGTGTSVFELVLYKKNERGHFIEYKPDPTAVKD